MKYYKKFTEEQIDTCKAAYEAYSADRKKTEEEIALIADYVGYLIYRANRAKTKYDEDKSKLMMYMSATNAASEAMAEWITSYGLERAQGPAREIMDQFMSREEE